MGNLKEHLEEHYYLLRALRIAGIPGADQESLPHFLGLLLAAAESPDRRSCCFVLPNASRVACTVATLLALSKLTWEFDDLAREYAQRTFESGQRVIVWPTGHVYEYSGVLEAEGRWSKRFRLKVLGKHEFRTLPITNVLRLEPTTRKSPKGQLVTPLGAGEEPDALHTLAGIKSWGNKSLYRNRVLYLTPKVKFESFLNSTALHIADEGGTLVGSVTDLLNALPWGSVNADGSFVSSDQYRVEGEPLLAITSSVENVAEASMLEEPFSRVVFSDGPERLVSNLQACDEIASLQKLIVIADHQSDEAVRVLEERGFCTCRLAPEEIHLGHDNHEEAKPAFFGRAFNAANNYQRLRLDATECRDEHLEAAASYLDQVGRYLNASEGDEEMKRCLQGLFHLLFLTSERCAPLVEQERDEIFDRIDALERDAGRRAMFVPEEMMIHMRKACGALRELIGHGTGRSESRKSKGEILLEILQANGAPGIRRRIIVTRYPHSVDVTRRWLQEKGVHDPVVWHRQFPETEAFDTIITLSWLNAERFGKLVRRYAAPEVRLLGYPFEQKWLQQFNSRLSRERITGELDRTERSKLLGLPESLLVPTQNGAPKQDPNDIQTQASDPFSIFDIEHKIMQRKKGGSPVVASAQETCSAKYVGFVGDAYAYLTESHEVPVITSLVANSSSAPSAILTRTVNGLETGDFLLFREGSDRDVVRLFAEEMMGPERYAEQRTLAASWRQALLSLGGNATEVYRLLQSYGLRKTKTTIRSWLVNSNVIGPWKREDLDVMAAAAKETFAEKPEKVWEAVENIRAAHRRAGHKILEWLLAELAGKRSLVADGGVKVDLDFGRCWIVEVEEIDGAMEQYPARQVNRLLWENGY